MKDIAMPNPIRMTRCLRHLPLAAPLFLLLLTACASRAEFPLQTYVPKTRELRPLGQLQLSNTQLQFEGLEGQMKLEYAGIMPESAGADMAGSTIYRVKNSADFFRKNAGKEAFCEEAPRWIAVNSPNGAPAWSNEIWLGILTMPDWATFRHAQDRICLGGAYVRARG
jgi:hypothetical protein